MINQQFTGTPTSRRFVVLPVAANVKAGDPLLVGVLPCVALDNYQSNEGGAVCLFGGTFTLTVVGQSVVSPQTTHKINPGDALYASGGTLDATTNVTYGFTIDAVTTDTPFGYLDPSYVAVQAGATDTAALVLLTNGM